MASHWPPEKLPVREVELRAMSYTVDRVKLLIEPGNTDDTLRIIASA
jgi:hypothetical protein